ncbi:MAG: ribonuclease HII [Nanoarchaeota archaeon]|nr:ribonuclease HII [Nanoarchaeota archaeon]
MHYIIGIDEAGRGPLAGPVAVGVVCIPKNFYPKNPRAKLPLRDSKKLPKHAREAWFQYIKAHPKIFYAVSMAHPKTIDRVNISNAVNLAATRALQKLVESCELKVKSYQIYVDAGIKINRKKLSTLNLQLTTLVRGDEKINAIKLASIIAKVTRDRYIIKKHREYPAYKFNVHKGYGTKIHLKALKAHGPCPLHRLTFIKKYISI